VISLPLHDALVRKLHPNQFPWLSSVMAAVVAFVLGTTFIEQPNRGNQGGGRFCSSSGRTRAPTAHLPICRLDTQLAESDRRRSSHGQRIHGGACSVRRQDRFRY